MPISIQGKVVIVTGGTGEVGASISRRLVAEGAKVVVADLSEDDALMAELAATGSAHFVKTDVTSESDTVRMADEAGAKFGRIDALVNNVSLLSATPWDQLSLYEWRRRMAVNVDGAFLATKAVVPLMTEQGKGKIISIGSDAVSMGASGFAHDVASKGAVMALTRAIANELGPRGITSCYVAPSLLDTPGSREAVPEARFDFVLGHTPIGRYETPEDVNGLIVFLCSDEAGFINGATIDIGGGIRMH